MLLCVSYLIAPTVTAAVVAAVLLHLSSQLILCSNLSSVRVTEILLLKDISELAANVEIHKLIPRCTAIPP